MKQRTTLTAPSYLWKPMFLGLFCCALAWPALAQKTNLRESPNLNGNGSETGTSGVIYTAGVDEHTVVSGQLLPGPRIFLAGVRLKPLIKLTGLLSPFSATAVFDVKAKTGMPSKRGNPQDNVLVLFSRENKDGCLELWAIQQEVEVLDGRLVSQGYKERLIFSQKGTNIVRAATTDKGKHWSIVLQVEDKKKQKDFWWTLSVDKNLKEISGTRFLLGAKNGEAKLNQYGVLGKSRDLVGRAADSPEVVYSFIEADFSDPGQHPWTLRVGTLNQKGKLDLTTKKLDTTSRGKLSQVGGLDTACTHRVSLDDPESGRMCMGELVLVFQAQSDRCPSFPRRQIYAVTYDPVEREFGKVLEVTRCPRTFDYRSAVIDYSAQTGSFLVAFMAATLGTTGEIRTRGLQLTDKGLRTTQPEETVLGSPGHSFDVVAFAPPIDNGVGPAVSQGDFFVTYVEDGPSTDKLYGNTIDMGCLAGADTLCLNDGDYRLRALYRTKQNESGYARAVSLTDDTGYFWFFEESNVEAVVKVLTPCRGSKHSWVFAGGLTDVEVELLVEEVATGFVRRYLNPLKTPFQPIQHTKAFPCQSNSLVAGDGTTAGFVSADAAFDALTGQLGELAGGGAIGTGFKNTAVELGSVDALASQRAQCKASGTALCLNQNRFRVEATYKTSEGQSGAANAVELTDDTGYFWFFKKSNVEAVVKILDPCKKREHFWVFGAGLTDVKVEITVTDTTNNKKKVYRNALGKPFRPIQDTEALPCS